MGHQPYPDVAERDPAEFPDSPGAGNRRPAPERALGTVLQPVGIPDSAGVYAAHQSVLFRRIAWAAILATRLAPGELFKDHRSDEIRIAHGVLQYAERVHAGR